MPNDVLREIATLDVMEASELKLKWQALFGTDAPAGNRAYLVRRLAWAIQNLHYGGNAESVRARLQGALLNAGLDPETGQAYRLSQRGRMGPEKPRPGTRWSKYWGGEWHEITFLPRGVSYRGVVYKSPSWVASMIIGSHTSGPRWFSQKSNESECRESRHGKH